MLFVRKKKKQFRFDRSILLTKHVSASEWQNAAAFDF